MNPTIRPFRDISEHEVINAFRTLGSPVNKGTFVKITTGWDNEAELNNMLGAVGYAYGNTVSQRYGVTPTVDVATSGSNVLGMTLYDVREVDENNEVLLYKPKKQDEMQCVLSGQAVPILRRGLIMYSGTTGAWSAGAPAYLNDVLNDGTVSPSGTVKVGTFLGVPDSHGFTMLLVDCRA